MVFTIHAQKFLDTKNPVSADAIDAEKIYLQLTGKTYNTLETIWFKAVVVDAYSHIPSSKSGILHVELIDPLNQQIVDSKLLKINNGIADGFFQLHSNYREGRYAIRAYTEWNKNFGIDFIFSTLIDVYQFNNVEDRPEPIGDVVFTKNISENTFSLSTKLFPLELDSLHQGKSTLYLNWKDGADSVEVKYKKNKDALVDIDIPVDIQLVNFRLKTANKEFSKSVVLDEEYGTLNFFPEGGSLVNGLESTVGFKYLDYRGKGAKVNGVIVDGDDREIIRFESNELGMGKLILQPKVGKTYYGVLKTRSGNTFKYPLPNANTSGGVLSISRTKKYRNLFFRSTRKTSDSIFIKIVHRGKDIFLLKSKVKKGRFSYALENDALPHGIIRATVYDNNHNPINERHFFNALPKKNLNIKLNTDKVDYSLRDSVSVSIETDFNGEPEVCSVSLMAVDADYFKETNLSRSSIESYFLLESDIRGEIENPFFYFKSERGLHELENLMLTQGWTNYKYDVPKRPRYFRAEERLEVSGTVGGLQKLTKRKRAKDNTYTVNMISFSDPLEVYSQEIDSTGFFRFTMNESYGNGLKFVIQPDDLRDKSKNFVVNIKKRNIPEVDYQLDKVISPVDSIVEKIVETKIAKNIRLDPFLLPNTIALEEVVLSDYELTPKRAEMKELHGLPDVVIDNKELLKKKKNWTGHLYRWLLFNYPGELEVVRVGPNGGFEIARVPGAGFTYVVIDGIPVNIEDYSAIGSIPLEAVKSAEILRNASTANRYCSDVFNGPCFSLPAFPAILALYTYSGKGLFGAFPKKTNLLNDTAPQFSPQREFYAPEYSNPAKIDWNVPDLRTLLHWQPNIVTDASGKAKTTFYNADTAGKIMIICEGITANGSVGYSEITYEVTEPMEE